MAAGDAARTTPCNMSASPARHPIPFAERNAEGYQCLLYVEVALRELARYELRTRHGDKWQKYIPGHYLQKIRHDQRDEAIHASFGFRRLGPLYYLTFGQLVEMSTQKPVVDRLKKVLGPQGPQLLQESIPSRNAISHCRDLTANALATLRTLQMRMATGLAAHELLPLLHEPDIGVAPEEARERLADWLRRVQSALSQFRSLPDDPQDYHVATRQYWWSSSELAGFDVECVDSLAAKLRQYSHLPGGVGAAAARQRFISKSGILTDLNAAFLTLGDT